MSEDLEHQGGAGEADEDPPATGSSTPPKKGGEGGAPPRTFFNWLRNTARLWGFLGFILVILIVFRGVVLPFVLALLVTYVLSPVLNFLCRLRLGSRGLPRWGWLIVLYLVLFSLNALFLTSFVPRVSSDLKRVVGEAPAFWQKARTKWMPKAAGWLQSNFGGELDEEGVPEPASRPATGAKVASPDAGPGESPKKPAAGLKITRLADGALALELGDVELDVTQVSPGRWVVRSKPKEEPGLEAGRLEARVNRAVESLVQSSERWLNQVLKFGQRALLGLLTAVTTFILVFMISAFLLIDTHRILAALRALVAPRFHQDFDNVIHLIDRGLSGAIRGQLLICVVNGILTWVGLTIFGVKYSMLLALLAGVMSLIPIFGSILSSIPIVLVAVTSGEQGIDLLLGGLMLGWIVLIHLIEANLLNPKIIGTAAKIHPVIVIFAVVAGERTYGPIGALLAVPLVSAVQAVFLYVRGKVREQDMASWPTLPGETKPPKKPA